MVVTRHGVGGSGYRSSSGTGTKPIVEGLWKFIVSEITRGILDATSVMFGSIKEGIIEMMEDRLHIFKSYLAAS